jgi:hypothetical protein
MTADEQHTQHEGTDGQPGQHPRRQAEVMTVNGIVYDWVPWMASKQSE